MPMDGLTLGFVARELNEALADGRIDRILQPERDELIMTVRNRGTNHLLLLSASTDSARAHLTTQKKTGLLEPPSLCMLLRKHLIGGRIASVRQIDCDRILEITVEHYDELGDRTHKRIIGEFMGKHSNLIFVDANERIIDSARHVTDAVSSVREVLPGLRYEDPPAHGKIPFDAVEKEALAEALSSRNGLVWKVLSATISGLSPQTARELACRATGDAEAHLESCDADAVAVRVASELRSILTEAPEPSVYRDEHGKALEFSAFDMRSIAFSQRETYATLSQAMDSYYALKDRVERIRQKSASIHRVLKTNIERCERKLALQQEALLASERMEEYRLKGELLTANLHLAAKGMKSVDVPNYYEEGIPTFTIPLDEKLSPGQNAQRYFKLYQKARSAQTLASEQISVTTAELDYLEGQMDNLGKCTDEPELVELRTELEKLGYVRANRNRRQMRDARESKPMKFTAASGRIILVGKNNLQNEKLTFSAQPDEIWLHAKDIPGSHVIIVGADPDEATILEAARYAAAYSKAGRSTRVSVDYTLRKYVKKPNGAKPGFVIYTHQRTLTVVPAERHDMQ